MQSITLTVTTDLTNDQRMQRICTTLSEEGYNVTLVGRKKHDSSPLSKTTYKQQRLSCFFTKGKSFYIEYNIRLFFYLLFKKTTIICAIDLDTLVAAYWASKCKKTTLVHDAHEYFSEVPEVVRRPKIQKFWQRIEQRIYPKLKYAYTVSESIAEEFNQLYNTSFEVIRNVPLLIPLPDVTPKEKYIVYSGALNEGRGLEQLIAAMKSIPVKLHVCGKGDLEQELKKRVIASGLSEKIVFMGNLQPEDLRKEICGAWLGYGLLEHKGKSYFYSLANKFFDYIHAELPQLAPNFPEYNAINNVYKVAIPCVLTEDDIVKQVNALLKNESVYESLKQATIKAKEELNWQNESKKLIAFYRKING